LITSVPAFVVPVADTAPALAWSPWTLKQIHALSDGYTPERQYEEIFGWLESIINLQHVDGAVAANWRNSMGEGLRAVIQGVVNTQALGSVMLGKIDKERAGLVMFRY
jgi:hypothetical protein